MSAQAGYKPPSVNETSFSCPYCGAHAAQKWYSTYACNELMGAPSVNNNHPISMPRMTTNRSGLYKISNLHMSKCFSCDKNSVWVADKLIFPAVMVAPLPNPDMPEDVKRDYLEASSILNLSPRGAAALLRSAIERLCKALGSEGKTIDQNIGDFVKAGLSPTVQRALDVVRVTGNAALHPGQSDVSDDRDVVLALFKLINVVVDKLVTEPRLVDDSFSSLPQSKIEAIKRRDGAKGKE